VLVSGTRSPSSVSTPTKNGPFGARFVSDDLTRLFPVQESLFATKISIRIKQTQRDITHEFCCLLNRLLPTRFASMFWRLLLQGLYRVRGKMFVPLHKVGLASHIRNTNWVFRTFDTDGEVFFATASTLTHQVFIGLPNMNRGYFGLRHQYQKCARAKSALRHFW
jgi:hypothetical protein